MKVAQMIPRSLILTMLLGLAVIGPNRAEAAEFEDVSAAPFGTFEGVDYVMYSGRFVGDNSKGAYRMPFEIVAPAEPAVIVTHEE